MSVKRNDSTPELAAQWAKIDEAAARAPTGPADAGYWANRRAAEERAEQSADTARLDWLSEQNITRLARWALPFASLREAIDEAMQRESRGMSW